MTSDKSRVLALVAEIERLERERDEALERAEDLENQATKVSEEFEGDCWKALRRLIDENNFVWDADDVDSGVNADTAEQFIRDTIVELVRERDEARAANERDRTMVADALGAVRSAIGARAWMRDTRGSFAWDDDRYQQEFGAALDEIEEATRTLSDIAANWKDSPTRWEDVVEARRNVKKQVSELEARLASLTAPLEGSRTTAEERAEYRKMAEDAPEYLSWATAILNDLDAATAQARTAVEEEREACAKVADSFGGGSILGGALATAIRARSKGESNG